ncbi:MAG: DUF4446 family protein [Lachnospiraceae bacterium]|nr:DUF4446 family protein [Lachnospiraceae bacterium]
MNTNLLDSIGLAGLDLSYIIIVLIVLWLAAMIIAIVALVRYQKLEKKYMQFMGGRNAGTLEEEILNVLETELGNKNQIEKNRQAIEVLNEKMGDTFQKCGIVRYDAFREMGGKLSFALTLLDERNDGFIINTVHRPEASYSYIKSVVGGKCGIELSGEEQKALHKALGTGEEQ